MSSSLPPELLDLIVDHLCDKPIALRACCLVSKSWIHRTRKHLFAYVEFDGFTPCIQSWMRAFPDPSNSPAHYTRSLSTRGFKSVTTAAMDTRAWVRSFRHLVHLAVATHGAQDESRVSLAQLKRLSPTLRSLHLCHYRIPLPEIIDLICSFPLLEDLSLIYLWDECDTDGWNMPPSPKFTGSLDLTGEVNTIARGLLELPGGLHFSEIKVTCADYHAESVMDLVSGCSDTLEYLYINFDFALRDTLPLFDLSKVTKLRDVEFRFGTQSVQWISKTLQTTRLNTLRQISLTSYDTFNATEDIVWEWQELDHLLIRLWISHSIIPKVTHEHPMGASTPNLVPKLTDKGAVCVVINDGIYDG